MFTFNVDLGQLIISFLIGLVGYFVKRTVDRMEMRLDEHDTMLYNLAGDIKEVVGRLSNLTQFSDSENYKRGRQ